MTGNETYIYNKDSMQGSLSFVQTYRLVALVVAGIFVVAAAGTAHAQSEVGGEETFDFGDAPSSYSVTLDDNGARHRDLGQAWLGVDVDDEPDARQVDNDDFDDGVEQFMPIEVTVNNRQYNDTLYLNVLVDIDGDGQWEPAAAATSSPATAPPADEWVVQNKALSIAEGERKTITTDASVAGAGIGAGVNTWVRVTLTGEPIPVYDGRGSFEIGETEDYHVQKSGAYIVTECVPCQDVTFHKPNFGWVFARGSTGGGVNFKLKGATPASMPAPPAAFGGGPPLGFNAKGHAGACGKPGGVSGTAIGTVKVSPANLHTLPGLFTPVLWNVNYSVASKRTGALATGVCQLGINHPPPDGGNGDHGGNGDNGEDGGKKDPKWPDLWVIIEGIVDLLDNLFGEDTPGIETPSSSGGSDGSENMDTKSLDTLMQWLETEKGWDAKIEEMQSLRADVKDAQQGGVTAEQKEALQRRYRQMRETSERIADILPTLRKHIGLLKVERQQLPQAIEEARRRLGAERQQKNALQEKQRELSQQITNLQNKKRSLRQDIDAQEDRRNNYHEQQNQTQTKEKREQLQQVKKQLQQHVEQNKAISAALQSLDISELEATLDDLLQHQQEPVLWKDLLSMHDRMKKQTDQLEAGLDEIKTEIVDMDLTGDGELQEEGTQPKEQQSADADQEQGEGQKQQEGQAETEVQRKEGADDEDGDGADEVDTEMVEMDLTGSSDRKQLPSLFRNPGGFFSGVFGRIGNVLGNIF